MLVGTLVEVHVQNARSLLNHAHIPHTLAHLLEDMSHTLSPGTFKPLLSHSVVQKFLFE